MDIAEISVLVVGIVQIIKYLTMDEHEVPQLSQKGTVAVALGVGVVLLSVSELVTGGYLSDSATEIVLMVVRILGGAIAIPGWFGVMTDEVLSRVGHRPTKEKWTHRITNNTMIHE